MRVSGRWNPGRLLGSILGVAALLAVVATAHAAPAEPEGADGKALFLAQKCNTCHSVSTAEIEHTTQSEKMKGPDLVGVVAEKGADWTTQYLRKAVDLNGKKHGKEVKLSDEELARLVAWLGQQKKAG
jgi:cytochrome c2